MDRRRFEDGFVLYAVRKTCKKYEIPTGNVSITSRNDLLDEVTEKFYDGFVEKWGGEHKIFYLIKTYRSTFNYMIQSYLMIIMCVSNISKHKAIVFNPFPVL